MKSKSRIIYLVHQNIMKLADQMKEGQDQQDWGMLDDTFKMLSDRLDSEYLQVIINRNKEAANLRQR